MESHSSYILLFKLTIDEKKGSEETFTICFDILKSRNVFFIYSFPGLTVV